MFNQTGQKVTNQFNPLTEVYLLWCHYDMDGESESELIAVYDDQEKAYKRRNVENDSYLPEEDMEDVYFAVETKQISKE